MVPTNFCYEKYLESRPYEGELIFRLNEAKVQEDYGPAVGKLILDSLFSFLRLHHRYNNELDPETEPPPDEIEKTHLVSEMQKLWPILDQYGVNPYAFIDLSRPSINHSSS